MATTFRSGHDDRVHAAAMRYGRASGRDGVTEDELARLRGVLKTEKMRAEIEAAVAQAPAFTDEQRRMLADLLVPGEGVRDAG